MSRMERVFRMPFASVYPLYVEKVAKKGRTEQELREVISWLTGFDGAALDAHIAAGTTFEELFAEATLAPGSSLITGVICGVRVEEIDDPLTQKIRYLDKVVDELARGKAIEKIERA